ncbi:MAG TPA: hypothetical protein VFS48_10165 [Solirubrobacterales bacterium]|nr:hypothetical protein [Solirubrobacterales bacterium]
MNIEEIRGPAAEDDVMEATVLQRLLCLHPTLVTPDELLRELVGEPDFSQSDAIERAVTALLGAGLLHRAEGLLVPSRAALRFDELLSRRSG